MDSKLVAFARRLLPSQHIYADWAASALPLPSEAPCFIPPHHAGGDALAVARKALRGFLCDSKYRHFIVFTSGTTASFQLIADRLPWTSECTFLCHAHAHNSLLGLRNTAIKNGAKFISFNTEDFEGLLNREGRRSCQTSFAVFAFPAECNLTGSRYPLRWASSVKKFGVLSYPPSRVITVVDTAKLLATCPFSLDDNPDIDALVFSLYKLSASYTGLGALLIRNMSLLHHLLQSTTSKSYFAGGRSVEALSPFSNTLFASAKDPNEFLQLGTPNMNAISALPKQLSYFSSKVMRSINESMSTIGCHFENLLKEAFPSCITHRDTSLADQKASGTTSVTFFRDKGNNPIGHNEVGTILAINRVFARTGCMCNIGACASVLGLSDKDVIRHYRKGHQCGGEMDLIDGKPTGVVRFSFGWGSTKGDADAIVRILRTFLVLAVYRPLSAAPRTSEKFKATDLYIYPVKGCAGSAVEFLMVDGMGSAMGDRAFGIEDFESKKILDVRLCHELTNISCCYEEDWKMLVFRTSRARSQKLGIKENITIDVRELLELNKDQHKNRGLLIDAYDNEKCEWTSERLRNADEIDNNLIHQWLSAVLERRVHLVRFLSSSDRGKANVLITTKSELEQLGREAGIERLSILMSAIRPNVVVRRMRSFPRAKDVHQDSEDLCDVNQLERFWNRKVMLKRSRSCTRCQIVNIIAKACGVENSGEPLRSIVRLSRIKKERGVVFGGLAKFMVQSFGVTYGEQELNETQEGSKYKLKRGDELQGDYYCND
ncbi:Molybdenum cofactor sulfurase [Gracilaria domingensis]|nr:Molybdenum cofactor sulfurase [Gracilaria domingensis]